MRLALVRQDYPYSGPTERYNESALEALLERDVAITLYTREWPRMRLQLIEPVLVDPFHIGPLGRDSGFARDVAHAISIARPDLVEAWDLMPGCDIYRAHAGLPSAVDSACAAEVSAHARLGRAMASWHRHRKQQEALLFGSPFLRAVVCPSDMVRDDILAAYPVPPERVHVIPHGVDGELFSPALRAQRARTRETLHIADSAIVYLLPAHDWIRHGVAAAIAALARLPAAAHLLVAAPADLAERCTQAARQAGVQTRVTHITSTDPVLLGVADACVLPTLYDALPVTGLEALSTGLPVITTWRCGLAEIVHAHRAGVVTSPRDTDALVAAMHAVLEPGPREAMGTRGRDAVSALTPAMATLALVQLYKALLEASVNDRRLRTAAAANAAEG